jgi:3-hydroxyisobutyrate dehydrogenase-like beta-hydroxyacid dehydrogenase
MTTLKTVGIISPGDMGHVVGQVLGAQGLRVITCLEDRSERTRTLAAKAGIDDVGTLPRLVQEAEIILSILVPAQAADAAQAAAKAIAATRTDLLYVDCNAIAPQTARQIEQMITGVGSRFVDASIIGPPPRKPGATRFYAAGEQAEAFAALSQFGLDIVILGDQAGQASAFKMCYAALTKGFTALCTELLTAAEALGISEALAQEFRQSQPGFYEHMNRALPGMPSKARRWVGEMEEIAQTFAQLGLTPQILAGAADMYRLVGETALADRTPEDTSPLPTLAEMVRVLAENLKRDK